MLPLSGDRTDAKGIKSEKLEESDTIRGSSTLKRGFAHMLKNGVVMDVTTAMNSWISGSLPNEGFIIKHDSEKENDTIDYGQLKFFSKETNTIYQPKIRIGWDDSIFVTGSLTALEADDINVTFKRLKTRYKISFL